MNIGGAIKGNPNLVACGALIRDLVGNWIFSFSKNLEICSAFMAKLWGVMGGVELAWSRGFKKIKLEFDSQVLIDKLLKHQLEDMLESSLLLRCREMINRRW